MSLYLVLLLLHCIGSLLAYVAALFVGSVCKLSGFLRRSEDGNINLLMGVGSVPPQQKFHFSMLLIFSYFTLRS